MSIFQPFLLTYSEMTWSTVHFLLHESVGSVSCLLSICVQILVSGFIVHLPNYRHVAIRHRTHCTDDKKTPPTTPSFHSIHWDKHEKLSLKKKNVRSTYQTWCKSQRLKAKARRVGILWLYGNTGLMSSWAHGSHVTELPASSLCCSVELLGFHGGQDVASLSVHSPQKDARPT